MDPSLDVPFNSSPVYVQLATLENEKALLQQQVCDLRKELEKKAEELDKSREDDSEGRSVGTGRFVFLCFMSCGIILLGTNEHYLCICL